MYTGKILARAIFEPNLCLYKYSNILKPSYSSYLSAYEDGTERSETSAYKIQTPGNYPEESIQQEDCSPNLATRFYLVVVVSYSCMSVSS
jgi:hypothetical protein